MVKNSAKIFVVATLVLSAPLGAEEFLPTPYTAEQIGEIWKQGYTTTMKVWTPQGETVSVTTVDSWSREEIKTSAQELDPSGSPVGDKEVGSSSWEALRDHAKFPAPLSKRERASRQIELGELEGWLYTVNHEDGRVSEFFFADDFPGPPVWFSQTKDGETLFRAETIEVTTAP